MNKKFTTIKIEKLVAGGDGVGRLDGMVCFVPFAAPGDHLRIKIVRHNRRFKRGQIVEILSPGPGRRPPPCPLFKDCGGCTWLHLDEQVQTEAKQNILSAALSSTAVTFAPSDQSLGYRTTTRLHVEPNSNGPSCCLGFTRAKKKSLVDVHGCPILTPELDVCLAQLRQELLGYVPERSEVRLALSESGPVVLVATRSPLPPEFYTRASQLAPGSLAGVLVSLDGVCSPIAGSGEVCTSGVDGEPYRAPAGCFSQANRQINQLIAETVSDWIVQGGFSSALELFGGAGNLTVALARLVTKMAVSDLNPEACRAARQNLSRRGLGHVAVHTGDAIDLYRELSDKYELVILDPPRSGHLELARALAQGKQRAVLYISCNPATLARDLNELKGAGYKMTRAAGFDMFPQTAHIEAAVLMER